MGGAPMAALPYTLFGCFSTTSGATCMNTCAYPSEDMCLPGCLSPSAYTIVIKRVPLCVCVHVCIKVRMCINREKSFMNGVSQNGIHILTTELP